MDERMVPDALTLAGVLYKTLRTMKSWRFNPDNYFWKIWQLTFAEMARDRVTLFRESMEEATLLYGIRVEVDYNKDFGLRLFEDITDTIGVPPEEKKVRCIDCEHLRTLLTQAKHLPGAFCASPVWKELEKQPHVVKHDLYEPIRCDYFEKKKKEEDEKDETN